MTIKKILFIFTILAAVLLTSSCQRELPDNIKNVDVSQGEKVLISEGMRE